MKIIHLTDLHFGDPDCDAANDRLFEEILTLRPKDHTVVISGDIAENASHVGKAWVAIQALSAFHPQVVPGNHDYGPNGASMRMPFVEAFEMQVYGADIDFPRITTRDNVTFIGLDSQIAKFLWDDVVDASIPGNPTTPCSARRRKPSWQPEGIWGCLCPDQLQALEKELNTAKGSRIVVYLHHDPVHGGGTGGLSNQGALMDVLKKHAVSALLCGHTHVLRSETVHGIPYFNGGSSKPPKSGDPARIYRIIDLETGQIDERPYP